jgi:hypothetical protein
MPPLTNKKLSTPLQSNYQSGLNFNIDISQVYSDFIQEIDANRSISNLNNFIAKSNSQFQLNTISTLSQYLKTESTPQESRAHCFYRLIGFPVISQNGNYYNPGTDPDNVANLSNKISIANSVSPAFLTLSLMRENYVNTTLSYFNTTPPTLNASVLALSSSTNTRAFSIPVSNTDPFNYNASNQQYSANLNSKVGQYQVTLGNYTDETGNLPTIFNIFTTRYHFIEPFIVDPRIDFTVNPSSRRVSVPFAANKKSLLIAENTYVKRPLIEKVIRDRYVSTQNAVISSSQQSIIDYVLNVPTIKNNQLLQQMVTNIYNQGPTTTAQFEKFLFIIQTMCSALNKAQLTIQQVQSYYYWLPQPSTIGPEGGSTVDAPIISTNLPSILITTRDQSIINLTLSQIANTFDTQTAPLNGIPDVGGFVFDAFNLTFNSDTSASFGNNVTTELNTLTGTRTTDLTAANTALQTIEIIMGEWSGLGLCDIVAIMGALYVMDINALLGFLDASAQQRAIAQGVVTTQASLPTVTDAQTSFVNTVANFYNLMDDIYKNISQNNSANTNR